MAHFNSFVRIPFLTLRQTVVPLPAIDTFEADVLRMRVWPNDIDFNLHLNNARHLSLMDYGRFHLLARGGLLTPILKARWMPVVGDIWMTYRRSLPLWAPFELSSRLTSWDERWFYMEQTFTGEKGLVAVGWVKAALRTKAGAVNPQLLMEMHRPGVVSPPVSEALEALNSLSRARLKSVR
jgi:acyl-CoA thioesterase FadM